MSEPDNAAIVGAVYERLLAGDVEGVVTEYMATDVVWDNPLPEPIPFGGTFQGGARVGEYVAHLFDALEIEDFNIHEIIAGADRVAVLGSETSRVKATGRSYTMEWVHVLRLENAKITHLREYNDTAAMLRAFD